MAGKDNQPPAPIITNGDMSAAVSSASFAMAWFDNICVTLWWSGTPTGTFDVQVSHDEVNWGSIDLSPVPVASGAAGVIVIDITQLSPRYIRVNYARTSGTGTLNATVSGKMV